MFAALLLAAGVTAQEKADTTYWTLEGVAGINLSQVSLSNWAAGGDGSMAFDLMFNYSADYKRDRHLWQNRLELAYGLNNTSSNGTRKTNDKIYLSSTYGYRVAKNLYLSGLLTFNTQFANGYDYSGDEPVFMSQFMAPGYLSVGAGLTWTPKRWFTATLAPATWRGTFVTDTRLSDTGAFGVDPGRRLLSEFGGNLRLEASYEFLPERTDSARLALLSDYRRKPENVDVRWDVQLQMKINKWFSANLTLNSIYDDDIKIPQKDGVAGPRFQFKEVLGIGLQARF